MEVLAVSLIFLGFLGIFISIIALIIQAIRKKKKKSWTLGLLGFVIILFIGGGLGGIGEKPTETQTETQVQTETEKPTKTSISYSQKEVYDFVMNYPIYGGDAKDLGYTISSVTDGMVGILRIEGQKVDVVEGKAEPTGKNGIWRVSYVVVADGKRDKIIWIADMDKKTVEPDNQNARLLIYGE